MNRYLTLKEPILFLKTLHYDYKTTPVDSKFTKSDKLSCFKTMIFYLLSEFWSGISAPFVYLVWYLFRELITTKVYKNTSIVEIATLITNNDTQTAKQKLQSNGKFLYWLWTYGELTHPLDNPQSFWQRYAYNAFRNPRFNINYMNFRTGTITESETIIDGRNFNILHMSAGISPSPDGVYFKYVRDNYGKTFLVYEDNNRDSIFYCEWVGLNTKDIGVSGARFETSYRKTENTITK